MKMTRNILEDFVKILVVPNAGRDPLINTKFGCSEVPVSIGEAPCRLTMKTLHNVQGDTSNAKRLCAI